MANEVTSHIRGIEDDQDVINAASELIDQVRGPDRPAGVIWVEYFVSDGETLAQVHFIPQSDADEVKEMLPDLAERF